MTPVSSVVMGLAAGLLFASAAWAQQDNPPQAAASPAGSASDGAGTTVVGDRESPIGLYLTPWKNEYAERGMDRPAQFVQEQMAPIDPEVFKRQNSYYDTITRFRQAEAGAKK